MKNMKNVIVDIETDGLDATKVHCIVAKEIGSPNMWTWDHTNLNEFNKENVRYQAEMQDELAKHNTALQRAGAYEEAGADAILIHSIQKNPEEIL